MTTRPITSAIILALMLAMAVPAAAQFSLVIPTSPRSHGMGYTGVADPGDQANTFFNPAILSMMNRIEVSGLTHKPIPEVSQLDLRAIGAGGGGQVWSNDDESLAITLGGAVQVLDVGLDYNAAGDQNIVAVALASGLSFTNGFQIGLGATFKTVEFTITDQRGHVRDPSGMAYDVGAVASFESGEAWHSRFALGVSTTNRGSDVEYTTETVSGQTTEVVELPDAVLIGIGFELAGPDHEILSDFAERSIPTFAIAANVSYQDYNVDDTDAVFGVGIEFTFVQIASLRLGAFDGPFSEEFRPTIGVGLGVPIKRVNLRFDWARYTPEDRDGINTLGGSAAFNF